MIHTKNCHLLAGGRVKILLEDLGMETEVTKNIKMTRQLLLPSQLVELGLIAGENMWALD
jgi:hypothetical protein